MQTGTKISGVAHVGLIGWMVFGGAFSSEPLPFQARDVSVVTAQEYAALLAAQQPPATAAQPAALPVPDIPVETPDLQAQPDVAPEQAQPSETQEPQTDAAPEALPVPLPAETEVSDAPPTLEPPQTEVSDLTPSRTPRPPMRPVDRVATTPVAPPPPDVRPDEVANPEVAPEDGATVQQDVQEATAPEEAVDEIVTEAEEVASLAPAQSRRPPSQRPERPTAAAASTPTRPSAPTPPADTSTAVNAALAEAMNGGTNTPTPVPAGPPLSEGEKDALRVSVSRCWNVGSLSTAAMSVTVVVGVSMTPDGKPEASSIRLLSSSGGSDAAAKQAFETARRAIIRCGGSGYDLPSEKYGQWRDIEMTFNPERMRIK